MIDSEASVNRRAPVVTLADSESLMRVGAKLSIVQSNRDQILSDFVRFKIREWLESVPGRQQQQLAAIAGFKSASTVAMVKRGLGVGAKTAPGWAKAFGYSSVEALVHAAWEWHQGTGAPLERRFADPNFVAGAKALEGFMVPPTEAELRAIASSFLDARFDDRDGHFWFNVIGTELKRDRERAKAEEDERKRVHGERKQREKQVRNAFRAAATKKRELAKRETEAALEAPSHEDLRQKLQA